MYNGGIAENNIYNLKYYLSALNKITRGAYD